MNLKLTPILPRPLNRAGINHALISAMRDIGESIRENFEDTTRTWNHDVKFEPPHVIPKVGIDFITVETTTADKIYGWVSKGTRKNYPIPRVPGVRRLAFPSEFIPKTFPGVIGSGLGFSGGVMRFKDVVIHPGIEARDFEAEIKNKQEKNFLALLKDGMAIARKASGHAYP